MTFDDLIGYILYAFLVAFGILGFLAMAGLFISVVFAIASFFGGVPCAPVPLGG